MGALDTATPGAAAIHISADLDRVMAAGKVQARIDTFVAY